MCGVCKEARDAVQGKDRVRVVCELKGWQRPHSSTDSIAQLTRGREFVDEKSSKGLESGEIRFISKR